MGDAVLQIGGKLVDIGGSDVHGQTILQQRGAAAADCLAANLYQQRLDGVGIKLLRGQSYDLAEGAAHR